MEFPKPYEHIIDGNKYITFYALGHTSVYKISDIGEVKQRLFTFKIKWKSWAVIP